jgi:hypothetical protein
LAPNGNDHALLEVSGKPGSLSKDFKVGAKVPNIIFDGGNKRCIIRIKEGPNGVSTTMIFLKKSIACGQFEKLLMRFNGEHEEQGG